LLKMRLEIINFLYCLLLTALVISFLLLFNVIVTERSIGAKSKRTYECGFNPYAGNVEFDYNIFYILLLFLLFDLELIFLFPTVYVFKLDTFVSASSIIYVLIIFTVFGLTLVVEMTSGIIDIQE